MKKHLKEKLGFNYYEVNLQIYILFTPLYFIYTIIFYLQIYILFMDKPLLHPLWIYSHNEL
jgi:hypothetical protein